MKKLLLLAVFVCSLFAWGQPPPDCAHGFCAGVGSPLSPRIPCKAGNKYTQLDSPGTSWSCTGVPPNWLQDGGSGTPLFAFQGYGDSYVSGVGATTPAIGSGFAQLARTIPAVPATNNGVSGLNSDSINFNVWTQAQPSPQQASAYLFNSGSNDDHNCGVSAACLANFSETANSSISYLAIPNQERVFGSACTQTAGTWTADTGSYPAPSPLYYLAPGSAVSASGTGAILTCTVPSRVASTRVGLNFQVTNAQTGTFTVTVDGVPQTDSCSGTTTFTSAPCGANLLTRTTVMFRQEFTGTSGTSHAVVITTTNAAKVDVTAVDTITPSPQANSNYVAVLGPNAGFDTSNTYNALLLSIANRFAADGARVAYADQQAGTPGVNSTTDTAITATANCTASTQSDHPNDVCGYYHLAQTVVNATKAAGWNIFGAPQALNTPVGATIVSTAGSTTAPSLTSSVDLTTGWRFPVTGQAEWTSGGFDMLILSSGNLFFRSNYFLRWSSAGASTSGNDTGISRGAAGVISIDTTTAQNGLGIVKTAAVLPGVLYSAAGTALPTCAAGIKGQSAVVSDATTPTYLGTYTSGGAVAAAVLCNGTNWVTH